MGQQIGYVRVSTLLQNTARQLDGVAVDRTFVDKASGKDVDRPALIECMKYLREGDTLHVHSIDRLSRSLGDMKRIVSELTARGVVVQFHKENLIFDGKNSASSNLLLNMLGAVAEFERDLILERQREGIAVAKSEGVYKGRKPSLTDEKIAEIVKRAENGEKKTALAAEFKISRETVYSYLRPKDAAVKQETVTA